MPATLPSPPVCATRRDMLDAIVALEHSLHNPVLADLFTLAMGWYLAALSEEEMAGLPSIHSR